MVAAVITAIRRIAETHAKADRSVAVVGQVVSGKLSQAEPHKRVECVEGDCL